MWMLYEKCGDEYIDVGCGPSGDRCKAIAKKITKSRRAELLIRDPGGRDWMKSVDTGSWRMKWVYVEGV